jgi:hypothetical protein
MVKPLSEQLADLSVRAKHAEDAFSAAQKEAHDARKQKACDAATTAVEKVNQELKSANDTTVRNWSTLKAKVAADINVLWANVQRLSTSTT